MKDEKRPQRIGLLGISGSFAGAILGFQNERIIIGRDPRLCNVVLRGQKISRKHCEILFDREKECYEVRDCSMNGVFREDGERLPKEKKVYLPRDSIIYMAGTEESFRLI